MTHSEFVKAVAERVTNPVADVDRVVRAAFDVIQHELSETGEISLLGLGKLTTSLRSARKGRNPRTGASVDIAERRVVRFKASKTLVL